MILYFYHFFMSDIFRLVSKYSPTGDQPTAIATLLESLDSGNQFQTLL